MINGSVKGECSPAFIQKVVRLLFNNPIDTFRFLHDTRYLTKNNTVKYFGNITFLKEEKKKNSNEVAEFGKE